MSCGHIYCGRVTVPGKTKNCDTGLSFTGILTAGSGGTQKLKNKRASIPFLYLRASPSCPACHCSCLILLQTIIWNTSQYPHHSATGEQLERQLRSARGQNNSSSLFLAGLSKCNNSEKATTQLLLEAYSGGFVMWGVVVWYHNPAPTFDNAQSKLPVSWLETGRGATACSCKQ